MKLVVTDGSGQLVGEVSPDPSCFPCNANGAEVGHVYGDFVAGPGFERIRKILDRFYPAYESGDLDQARSIHDEIDRIGLVAEDSDGRRYFVCNLYQQDRRLMFFASAESAWRREGGPPWTTLVPPSGSKS
jgi:hypothetical protein